MSGGFRVTGGTVIAGVLTDGVEIDVSGTLTGGSDTEGTVTDGTVTEGTLDGTETSGGLTFVGGAPLDRGAVLGAEVGPDPPAPGVDGVVDDGGA